MNLQYFARQFSTVRNWAVNTLVYMRRIRIMTDYGIVAVIPRGYRQGRLGVESPGPRYPEGKTGQRCSDCGPDESALPPEADIRLQRKICR